MASIARLIAVCVGNTRTQVGEFAGGSLKTPQRLPNTDLPAVVQAITHAWKAAHGDADGSDPFLVMASVNDSVADRLASTLGDQLSTGVYRIGRDIPIPIGQQLDPETLTGVDRLLNAAAAYDRVKQACVIVDAGTAVTVDFVDGEGTFHGGAIAPGAAMQMRAMYEHTAALPDLSFQPPDAGEAFGRNTAQAMYQGVYHGIRGMVQRLVEQYAEAYGAFPMVIATGGDAQALFANDELIDRVVPDLTLIGIAAAARHALSDETASERERNAASDEVEEA